MKSFINIRKIPTIIGIIIMAYACTTDHIGQVPIDNIAPGKVTLGKVTSLNGAVKIAFTPPSDEDILYIEAQYNIKGEEKKSRVSLYERDILIEGFADTIETNVKLLAVDRSKNESESVIVTVKPLKLPKDIVFESLKLSTDFGGVRVQWENPSGANVAIICYVNDTISGEMLEYDQLYTSRTNGWHAFRGLESKERKFQVQIKDRWGNYSDKGTIVTTPLFEKKLDRKVMKCLGLDSDVPLNGDYGGHHTTLFDGSLYRKYQSKIAKNWPVSFTVDLGVKSTLSRFKLFQFELGNRFGFKRLNVAQFEVWGWTGEGYPKDDWNNPAWVFMGEYTVEKPSGLPYNQLSNEDKEAVKAGKEFIVPFGADAVRYTRFKITETFNRTTKYGGPGSDGNRFFIAELEFWGDIR